MSDSESAGRRINIRPVSHSGCSGARRTDKPYSDRCIGGQRELSIAFCTFSSIGTVTGTRDSWESMRQGVSCFVAVLGFVIRSPHNLETAWLRILLVRCQIPQSPARGENVRTFDLRPRTLARVDFQQFENPDSELVGWKSHVQ